MASEQELNDVLDAVTGSLPEISGEDDLELSEELADTATIETLLDGFIQEVSELFTMAVDVSLDGNPVRTHLELVNFGTDLVELTYQLRRDLVSKLASAEKLAENGNMLRTQVNPPIVEES
jgi:hypothetical protein